MASSFIPPAGDLPAQNPLVQGENERDDVFALMSMALAEIRDVTDRLAAGLLTVDEWVALMTNILATYHLAGWVAGSGIDDPTDADLDYLAGFLADELGYLDGFYEALRAEPDGVQLPEKYRARADQYAMATQIALWVGLGGFFDWPAYPGQRSTCRRNCRCSMQFDFIDAALGDADMYWLLDSAAENCPECIARAAGWRPFSIRRFEWLPNQITADMFA